MKTNLAYYSRRTDSHRHPKFLALRTSFKNNEQGWAMEARFWALNDFIAEAHDCRLDLSLKRNKAVIANELNLSLLELQEFIELLSSPEIELIYEIEPDIFTTQKVQETYEEVKTSREKERAKKANKGKTNFTEGKNDFTEGKEEIPQGTEQQIKIKEIKENKTKENNNKEKRESRDDDNFSLIKGDPEKIKAWVADLFAIHAKNESPNLKADIDPIIGHLKDAGEGLTPEICYHLIEESFIALAQSPRDDTGYLLGIIVNKKKSVYEEALKNKKNREIKQAAQDRKTETESEAEHIKTYNAQKLEEYYVFFDNNSDMFSAKEKVEFSQAYKKKSVQLCGLIIEPKMEESKEEIKNYDE